MIGSRTVVATALALTAVTALAACSTPKPPEPPVTVVVTVTPTPVPPPVTMAESTAPEPPVVVVPPVPNEPAPAVVEGPAEDLGARQAPRRSPEPTVPAPWSATRSSTATASTTSPSVSTCPQQQLLRMNPKIPNFGEDIYVGTVINLDWTKTG